MTEIREVMKQLSQYVTGTQEQVKRLEGSERKLTGQVETLSAQVKMAQGRLFDREEEVRQLTIERNDLAGQVKDLSRRVEQGDDALNRRVEDAEGRAQLYETRCDELSAQAEHGVLLDEKVGALLNALDRLPESMDDASLIPTVEASIPLYRTYDWQVVMDAKFAVKAAKGDK